MVLALWIILVHILYQKRVVVAKGGDLDAPSLTLAIVNTWRDHVSKLLEAYAQLDPENTFDRINMENWRAQFSLHEWYQKGPIEHWDKVIIAFPAVP